jgi:hypothetical protein
MKKKIKNGDVVVFKYLIIEGAIGIASKVKKGHCEVRVTNIVWFKNVPIKILIGLGKL